MNNSERIKKLLRGYFEGKLRDTERWSLFYLIHQEDLKQAIFSELYKVWDESPVKNKHLPSGKIFDRIKAKANINDEMLTEGKLILEVFKYDKLLPLKTKLYSLLKYAAVILVTALFSGIAYYMTGRMKTEEIARNVITVPYGSKIKIMLADSSQVWLNSGSTLSYPNRFAESSREVHLTGEAFFEIRRNPNQPFYVSTSNIDIKVLGTSFNLKSYPEDDLVETTLVSGQLMIKAKGTIRSGETTAVLNPNQKAYYSKKVNKLAIERSVSLKDMKSEVKDSTIFTNIQIAENIDHPILNLTVETAWKENRLMFRNESFGNLAKKLERWYNVEITIKDIEVHDYKYTGSIENETIEQAMKAICFASGFDYSIDFNKIEIKNNN